jgi:hypothetical protein
MIFASANITRNEIPSVKTIGDGAPVDCLLDKFPQQFDVMYETTTCILSQQGNASRSVSAASAISRPGSIRQSRAAIFRDTTTRISDRSWSPTLHLVPKEHNGWRPCGNYRTMKCRNIPDVYPVRHIPDYLHLSFRCALFPAKVMPPPPP